MVIDALNHLIELSGNVSDSYTIALYVVDYNEEYLILRNHLSLNPRTKLSQEIALNKEPLESVSHSRKPIVIDRFDENIFYKKLFKSREELKSLLILPVFHDKLEGILFAASKSGYSYPPKMQKILTGFADQIAWHMQQDSRPTQKRHRSWLSL